MHWCGVDLQFISSTHPENEIITEEQRIESIQQTLSLTDTKIAQYRTLFHDLDKDGNGNLNNGEIKNALYFLKITVTDGELQDIIEKFDKDDDGHIDFAEFVAIIGSKSIGAEKESQYLQIFQSLDKNRNGFLSETELMNGMQEIFNDEEIDQEKLKEALSEVNVNSKGEFKYSDFVKAMTLNSILK